MALLAEPVTLRQRSVRMGYTPRLSPMKRRAFQAIGLALVIASPIWHTMAEQPNYFLFANAFLLGLLLIVLGRLS